MLYIYSHDTINNYFFNFAQEKPSPPIFKSIRDFNELSEIEKTIFAYELSAYKNFEKKKLKTSVKYLAIGLKKLTAGTIGVLILLPIFLLVDPITSIN